MKFGYQFSNLCGTVYRDGNLIFTPDGNSIVSPVGNRLSVFDLVNNKTVTLPCENNKNIHRLALSPNGTILISVDIEGRALLINYVQGIILNHFNFKEKISVIKFSPNGRYFAIGIGNHMQVWKTPELHKEFAPFVLHRVYTGHYDEVTSLSWSDCGRLIITGSKDMTARIYTLHPLEGYKPLTLSGHRNYLRGVFFSKNCDYIYTVSKDGALFIWKNVSGAEKHEIKWHLENKYFFEKNHAKVVSCEFHLNLQLLVVGFSSGIFSIFELPEINEIHSLSISQKRITTVAINPNGEWLAFGCAKAGQLLVWEWKSETYILKQQGHFYDMNVLDYSPDGRLVVTGGDDSKVKVWNTRTGFCFVTFKEHSGAITGVKFSPKGKAIFTSSLDGTVRAFDLSRYRNFRTFTSPSPVQFCSLAVDISGDIVCAGAFDTFEIFVWNVQTGRLLEVLSGHEGPVTCLSFSPATPVLYSGSWDHSVRVWDVFDNKGGAEVLVHKSDVRGIAIRPDGGELCVTTLDGDLSFWDLGENRLIGAMSCRRDLGSGRKVNDLISAQNNVSGKCFTNVCYSADGRCIVAGGKSKFVCIYEVAQKVLLKKFRVSNNQSFDGLNDKLNSKFMTEAGTIESIDHDDDSDIEGRKDNYLPGVKAGELSSRKVRPEIRVKDIRFSPTGRAWAACTTEGLVIYSLDDRVAFDPFDLDIDVTPTRVLTLLQQEEYTKSLSMSFRLNEKDLIKRVIESIPQDNILNVVQSLHKVYVTKVLNFVGEDLENSPHLEFYMTWCFHIFNCHGQYLKDNAGENMSVYRLLQKNISQYYERLNKLCDENKYRMNYIVSLSQTMKKAEPITMGDGMDLDS